MRILNVAHQYLPEFVGGTELYTQAIGRAMRLRGHETAIFYRGYSARTGNSVLEREASEGILYEAGTGPASPAQRFLASFGNSALQRQWLETLDRFRPDVVHVQHLMGFPMEMLDALSERGIPYLVTLLDYWWVCANANLLTNYDGSACTGPQMYLNCAHCAVARSGRSAAWLAAPAAAAGLAWRAARLRRILEAPPRC